ncbi:MAG: hypothetical protein ACPG6Y_04050 [Candidatus Puniceispirillaceae bacterium]|jgi:hypothetical protein
MIAKRKAMLSALEVCRNICYDAGDRMQALLLRPISIFSYLSSWQAAA